MENKNPNKIIDTDEKILDFNKHQKGKGLKLQASASEITNSTCTSKAFLESHTIRVT